MLVGRLSLSAWCCSSHCCLSVGTGRFFVLAEMTRTAYSCARSRLWACCDRMFICTRLFQPDARPGAERTHRTNRSDHDWRPTTTTQDFCFKFYKGSVGSSTELARLAYDVGGQFLSRPPCLLVSLSKRRPKSFRHAGCSGVCVA